MKKSIERILYTAIFTGALLSMQNNLAYAQPGDVYDLSTGFKFTKEHVTSNNSVVSFLEEKIEKGNKIVKELPDSRFIYVEGFKKDYQKYLKQEFTQEEALMKAIGNNLITSQEELEKIENSVNFFEQNTSLAVDVNGDVIRVSGNTLDGKALINVYDISNNEVYIGHTEGNGIGLYEYIFDFQGNITGNYKIVVQDSILGNKQESNIEYKEQEIKEIPKLEDVSINYGDKYNLPKTVEILTQDKETLSGNYIKNVMVVWDKELDNQKPGEQEFVGKLLNVTTGSSIQLKIKVGDQNPTEAVNERFKKLDDLMKQDIDFVEKKTNSQINEALISVQEALNNENLKDEEFKNTMQSKVNVHAAQIEKINTLKNDIEGYETLLATGNFTLEEVDKEYHDYYDKLADLYNRFNRTVADNVRERKDAASLWYTKNSYEFNNIKYNIMSDLSVIHRDMTYLAPEKNQERYNKIEEFRTICNKIGDLNKYKFNKSTTEALKTIQSNLLDKVKTIIVDNGGLKLNKGADTNKIEATLVGVKLNNLSSYKIEILDEDQYGSNITVSVDGTITLDSDKGNDDNTRYEQIIVVKDSLWNVQSPIKVIITDCQGKDTFEISSENSNKIVELQQFEDVTLTLGDSEYKLPSQVKARLLDNTENMVNVTWDKELSTDTVGDFEFIGKVEGTTLTTNIRVVVKQFNELELLEYYIEILENKLDDNINLSDEANLAKAETALNDAKGTLANVEDSEEKEVLRSRIDKCENLIMTIKDININIDALKSKESSLVSNSYSHIRDYQDLHETIQSQLSEGLNIPTKDSYLETLKTSKAAVRSKIYFSGNTMVSTNQEGNAIKFVFAGQDITNLSEYEIKVNDRDNYGKKVDVDLLTGKIKLNNDLPANNGNVYMQEISVKNTFWDISGNIYVEIKDVKDKDIIIINNIKGIEPLQEVSLNIGEQCNLQDTIIGKDNNDRAIVLKVKWDYSDVDIQKEGNYVVKGSVEGSFRTVEVNVNVRTFSLEERLQNKIANLNSVFAENVDLSIAENMQRGEKTILETEEIIDEVKATGVDTSEETKVVEKCKVAVNETQLTLQLMGKLDGLIQDDLSDNAKLSEAKEGREEAGYKLYWDKEGSNITGKVPDETKRVLYEKFDSQYKYVSSVSTLSDQVNKLSKALEDLKANKSEENIQKFNEQYNKVRQLDFNICKENTKNGFMNKISAMKEEADNLLKPVEVTIVEIVPMSSVSVEVNTEYVLPETVEAKMSDDTLKNVSVVWRVNGEEKTSIVETEIGQIIAVGTVEGFNRTVTLTINVVAEIIETDLDKLNKFIDELNNVFTENLDLTISNNAILVEEKILNAKNLVSKIQEDTTVQQGVISKVEVALNETNLMLQQIKKCNEYMDIDDLSNCTYLEWGEGQSRIEEIDSKYVEIAHKVYWPGENNPNNIEYKLTKSTVEGIQIKLGDINAKHDSIKVNLINNLKNIEELNVLLDEFKEDPTNTEKHSVIIDKYNQPVNYDGLNEATVNGFKVKRVYIKNEIDRISEGISSTTSAAITIKLDKINTHNQANTGQANTNPSKDEVYVRREDILGLKRTVISNVQEFVKKISRKFK